MEQESFRMERNIKMMYILSLFAFGLATTKADTLCPNDGTYPVPGDCSRYMRCNHGNAVVLPCPTGLLYNTDSGVCDYPTHVHCDNSQDVVERHAQQERPTTRHRATRPPRRISDHATRPSRPNKYHSTRPSRPNRYHATRPARPSSHGGANHAARPQGGCTTGTFSSHTSDCSQYYVCVSGKLLEYNCPPGTYYNSRIKVCTADYDGCFLETDSKILAQFSSTSSHRPVNQQTSPSAHRQRTPNQYGSSHTPSQGASNRPMRTLIDDIMASLDEIKSQCRQWVDDLIKKEAELASMPRIAAKSKKPFRMVQNFMGSTPIVKQISHSGTLQARVLKVIKERFNLDKQQMQTVMKALGRVLRFDIDELAPHIKTKSEPADCPFSPHSRAECDQTAKYRTIDGSCNNLENPLWGRSFRPLLREQTPDYADGVDAPRVASNGDPLPSARLVSSTIFQDVDRPSPIHTIFMMTFGQFLDHDLSRTAMSKLNTDPDGTGTMVDVQCGTSGCETEGVANRHCLPIVIPDNDPDFGSRECLMFVRSEASPSDNCAIGPREQLNQLTSFLDGSMVYESTVEKLQALRVEDPARGSLRVEPHPSGFRELLPFFEDEDCRDTTSTQRCFLAGEGRVNEQVALMAIHTVYHRYHNEIEGRLHEINPSWSGDRLFEETRRIVGAQWQYQIFNEYLPIVLGTETMQKYGLTLEQTGYFNGYDETVNADITNVFATAAFRFAHSSIPSQYQFFNKKLEVLDTSRLSENLMRPARMYTEYPEGDPPIDALLRGQVIQPMQQIEQHFVKDISAKLFSENPPTTSGTDLLSLNIQRGRDHGTNGYTAWREWCGLSVPQTFQDMEDVPQSVKDRFSELFDSVHDVDLYPAGVSEEHVPGGIVGPTFACIIGRQFRSLRVGDRFWFERQDPITGFTSDQMTEIRKSLISRVLCDTGDAIDIIQPYVLLQPVTTAFKNLRGHSYRTIYSLASLYRGNNNERRSCAEIPDIDLEKWRE